LLNKLPTLCEPITRRSMLRRLRNEYSVRRSL
jgi:hypothetical protein